MYVKVYNLITGLNEPKLLEKHISYDSKCSFHESKCNSNQNRNKNIC